MLDNTGERFVPGTLSPENAFEHMHRYELAASLVAGKSVLDLASGEGYGAARLAHEAQRVVGLELDSVTVAAAQKKYAQPNLSFEVGSITAIPNLPGPFDVVTCFEALEHVKEHDDLLAGVLRNISPGGVFLVSTPDKAQYSDATGFVNPFHVRELYIKDFSALLRRYFKHVALYGQRVHSGSLMRLLHEQPAGSQLSSPPQRDLFVQQDQHGAYRRSEAQSLVPLYIVAVCSNASLPALPSSSDLINLDDSHLLPYRRYVAHLESQLRQETERSRQMGAKAVKDMQLLKDQIASQANEVQLLRDQLAAQAQSIELLGRERDQKTLIITDALASRPVRWALRLRGIIQKIRRLGQHPGA